MIEQLLTYDVAGATMESWFCCGGGEEARAGVLVFPEAFGLGDHARNSARRLSGLGYAALACDVYGGGSQIAMADTRAATHSFRSDRARILAHAQAALSALGGRTEVNVDRIAAIGYCFGGLFVMELARSNAAITAAVAFHGGLANDDPRPIVPIKPRVLACVGADDPATSAAMRSSFEGEMRAADADWQMHVYGGTVHGFTDPDAARLNVPGVVRYNPEADARSWAAMLGLFAETIARPDR